MNLTTTLSVGDEANATSIPFFHQRKGPVKHIGHLTNFEIKGHGECR